LICISTWTILQFSSLNFLVGENSTGKSSVLSILNLLSDSFTSISGQFRNSNINLGPFDEIVSRHSKDRSSFHIGIIKEGSDSVFDKYLQQDVLLLSFRSNKGYPVIAQSIFLVEKKAFRLTYTESQVSYSLQDLSKLKSFSLRSYIKTWKSGRGFRRNILDYDKVPYREDDLYFFYQNIYWIFSYIKYGRRRLERGPKNLFNKYYQEFEHMSHGSTDVLSSTYWFAPIRTRPERIYEPGLIDYTADGNHTPALLNEIYKRETKNTKKFIEALESFGKESGLFESIMIEPYGNSEYSPFELKVKSHGRIFKISNVGYGVSQILPIITELLNQPSNKVFLIQQPEVHLHPRSQAQFGELLFNLVSKGSNNFFVETHSEYVINRLRIMIKTQKRSITKHIRIQFFESDQDGNKVSTIKLNSRGDYVQGFPDSFRDFFLNEEIALLGF